jgi:hypothetical protein
MHDDKRQLRKLKREIKKTGNRKRRRYLKDVNAAVPSSITAGDEWLPVYADFVADFVASRFTVCVNPTPHSH